MHNFLMDTESLVVHHIVQGGLGGAGGGLLIIYSCSTCRWKETHLEPARTNSFEISQRRR